MAATFLRTLGRLRCVAPAIAVACVASACSAGSKLAFGAPTAVDPTSPLAAEVRAASKDKSAYPRFADVPPAPTDVRPATAWTRNVYDTLQQRRRQTALDALYPQILFGTEAWAKAARAEAVVPPTPEQSAQTEAYAKALRDRATPPPPAQ